MVGNCHREFDHVGDRTRGDWAAIDYFQGAGFEEADEGEIVVAGEVFIYEGEAWGSAVNQGVAVDHAVMFTGT